jgi:hypothetical protein
LKKVISNSFAQVGLLIDIELAALSNIFRRPIIALFPWHSAGKQFIIAVAHCFVVDLVLRSNEYFVSFSERLRLVSSPEQWRWSSFRWYLRGEVAPVRINDMDLMAMKIGPPAA